jgi:hypothetical protein
MEQSMSQGQDISGILTGVNQIVASLPSSSTANNNSSTTGTPAT